MYKEGNKMVIIGTVSGGGWTCTRPYKGIASPWGPNYDIVDQRWNSVSAHMEWISKIITGSDVDLCKPGKHENHDHLPFEYLNTTMSIRITCPINHLESPPSLNLSLRKF